MQTLSPILGWAVSAKGFKSKCQRNSAYNGMSSKTTSWTPKRSLKEHIYFADATLACDVDQQLEAHKVVLASPSPVLQNI